MSVTLRRRDGTVIGEGATIRNIAEVLVELKTEVARDEEIIRKSPLADLSPMEREAKIGTLLMALSTPRVPWWVRRAIWRVKVKRTLHRLFDLFRRL